MADIFISYASEDRDKVTPIVKALKEEDWSVWWDWTSIPIGKTWRQFIDEGLNEARCVLVLWSQKSIHSEWVIEEADHGKGNRMLVPVLIDDVRPPIGFRQMQAANLINWTGEKHHPEFKKLLHALELILGASPKHVKETARAKEENSKRKQEEERRKVEERRRFEEEQKREAEAKRKLKEAEEQERKKKAEGERKAEEERKRKGAVKEAERERITEAEYIVQEERKSTLRIKNNVLKSSVVLVVILLISGGIWWFISESEKEKKRISELEKEKFRVETERKIAEIIDIINNQKQNIAKIERSEQVYAFQKQKTDLDKEIADIEHKASIAGISQQAQKARKLLEEFSSLLSKQKLKMEEAENLAKAKPPIIETKMGRLFVVSVPENASIRILNVNKRFQQGIELEPGKYHVQVSLQDYETQDRWIELNANEEKRINFELKKEVPKVARLYVEAIPENAQVRILNIKSKFSPGMEIEAGSYQLELSAEGYETQIRWVELKPGHKEPFRFELVKRPQEPTRPKPDVPPPVVKPEPSVAAVPSRTVINGFDADYPPFSFVGKDGKPAGFDMEALDWIANEMGFKVKHQPTDWAAIVPTLQAKKIDIVASGMSITPERQAAVNFTEPYWTVQQRLVVKNESTLTEKQCLEPGRKIALLRGSAESKWMTEYLLKKGYSFELKAYDTTRLAIEDVANGRADCAAVSNTALKNAQDKGLKVKSIGSYGQPDTNYGYAVRKDDTELLNKLNEGWKKLKASPKFQELVKKWELR